jgi:hypothetical protein
MAELRSQTLFVPTNDASFRVKQRRNVPAEFVLEALRPEPIRCPGVWRYTSEKDCAVAARQARRDSGSLRREFPNLRSIQIVGKKVTGWQVDAADFAEAALPACDLIPAGARIGKMPKERKGSGAARKRKNKLRGRLVE